MKAGWLAARTTTTSFCHKHAGTALEIEYSVDVEIFVRVLRLLRPGGCPTKCYNCARRGSQTLYFLLEELIVAYGIVGYRKMVAEPMT